MIRRLFGAAATLHTEAKRKSMKCIDHVLADVSRFILKLLLSIETKTEILSLITQDQTREIIKRMDYILESGESGEQAITLMLIISLRKHIIVE